MQIKLAEQDKILGTAPILAIFGDDLRFKPGILCVGEGFIFVYCDQAPDSINNDIGTYSAKFRFNIKNIVSITNEKMYKNPGVRGFKRLNIRHVDDHKSLYLYYYIKDERYINGVLDLLKRRHVKIKKKKVDTSKIF